MNQHKHRGGCHCGNLRWTLRSELSLAQLPVRTCGCRFCRKHGLLMTSDPQGEMDFILTPFPISTDGSKEAIGEPKGALMRAQQWPLGNS